MKNIAYDTAPTNEKYDFKWSSYNDTYLSRLREEFNLIELTKDCKSDLDKAKTVMDWVHNLWEHDGYNEPVKDDPISILSEVQEGKNFRCVEYGIVISGCLNALGVPSRKLSLRTEDVETREFGAGHVVLEAYIKELNKWIFIDGQFNIIPMNNKIPLNAYEFQQALYSESNSLSAINYSDMSIEDYFKWIKEYLYYFATKLDNRVGKNPNSETLLLGPIGAKNPSVFQRNYPMSHIYTHSVSSFYPVPI